MTNYSIEIGIGALAFLLPLTLLWPGFSIWEVVPKVHINRHPLVSQQLSWSQLCGAIIVAVTLLFCLFLEMRKRRLDDMVTDVLAIHEATDSALAVERDRQAAAVRACSQLLDVSTEHYENLVLLGYELRQRNRDKQHPPTIEPSDSVIEACVT